MKILLFVVGAFFGSTATILWLLLLAVGERDEAKNHRWHD